MHSSEAAERGRRRLRPPSDDLAKLMLDGSGNNHRC